MFKARTGSSFIVSDHHERISAALEQVVNGSLPDGARNLLINVPPRYGKTELAVINFVAWCMARNPAARFIHLSYADKLAMDNSSQIRELMKHEAYSGLWNIEWKQDSDAKGLWKTTVGGGLMASPAGGTITGFGAGATTLQAHGQSFAGAIIIDDPLKPDDARSDVERANVNERLINTIMSRRNSRETPIILIMQRLHEDDMTGFILSGRTGEKWHHLKLAAINDNGEALWPHKHTVDELNAIKASSPYMFSGQYQQEPAPEEGVFFRKEMFVEYDPDTFPKTVTHYGTSDYAVTADGGDWTVHVDWAIDQHGDIWVPPGGFWRQRASSDVWVEAFLNLVARYKPVLWAGERGQILKSLGPYINKRMVERNTYVDLRDFASATDKATRARSIQARWSVRPVKLPKGEPWVADFIQEHLMFPNGRNDDIVDNSSKLGQILDEMYTPKVDAAKFNGVRRQVV